MLGSVGDGLDNGLVESLFVTLQTELLNRRSWTTRSQLATAIFEYAECFYNPHRGHSALSYLSDMYGVRPTTVPLSGLGHTARRS